MSSIQRSSSATDSIYCGACSQPDDMNDMKRCCKCKITIHNNCIIKFIGDHSELKDREQWLCHACSVPIKEVTDCCACFATCSRLYKVPVSNTSAWVHLACQFARPLKTQKQKKKEKECCICKEGNLRLVRYLSCLYRKLIIIIIIFI